MSEEQAHRKASLLERWRGWLFAALLIVLLPIVAYELAYLVYLPAAAVPRTRPVLRSPAFAADALWMDRAGDAPRLRRLWAGRLVAMFVEIARSAGPTPDELEFVVSWVGLDLLRKSGVVLPSNNGRERLAMETWLTRHWTTADLRAYLADEMSFGRKAVGFDAAARAYFGIAATELKPNEVALLVARSRHTVLEDDPSCDPRALDKARADALSAMRRAGLVNAVEAAALATEEVRVLPLGAPCPLDGSR